VNSVEANKFIWWSWIQFAIIITQAYFRKHNNNDKIIFIYIANMYMYMYIYISS
jgi:hypothetical protein